MGSVRPKEPFTPTLCFSVVKTGCHEHGVKLSSAQHSMTVRVSYHGMEDLHSLAAERGFEGKTLALFTSCDRDVNGVAWSDLPVWGHFTLRAGRHYHLVGLGDRK